MSATSTSTSAATAAVAADVPIINPEDRIGQLLAGRVELIGILGVGAYGVVYNAVDVFTCTPYAVKALTKCHNGGSPGVGGHGHLDPRQRQFQQREIALHLKASTHPNVVSLVKIVETAECVFVILEYCPEGDLFTNITEHGHYVGNDALAKRVFLHLLDAVEHCHSLGIYHRDLKPENVLVCDRGQRLKLADFGLATTDRFTSDFGCGSTFYMSPECQQASASNRCYESGPNDVWSLGVILVNLTCGRNPWKRASLSDSTYRAFLKDRQFLRTILPISAGLNSIFQRVFEPDPSKRIGLSELRARVIACTKLTTGPAPPKLVDCPPHFHFSQCSTPASVSSGGILTPPDSAPATPLHSQSVHTEFPFNKTSSTATSSPTCYPEDRVVTTSSTHFVSSPRNFWPFQLFRREDVAVRPHHGVTVF